MDDKPRWMHDCQNCVFLGTHSQAAPGLLGEQIRDLYVCPENAGGPLLVARYGSLSGERMIYTWGAEVPIHPFLREARDRALARGLICVAPDDDASASMDLGDALDLIEKGTDVKISESSHVCAWCGPIVVWGQTLAHCESCVAALFLRKHGRKVRIQGDPK